MQRSGGHCTVTRHGLKMACVDLGSERINMMHQNVGHESGGRPLSATVPNILLPRALATILNVFLRETLAHNETRCELESGGCA